MYVAYHFHVDIIVWCVCIYIYLLIKKVVKHYWNDITSSIVYYFDDFNFRSDGNLTAGFDGAWQKRGTGRAYNSLTG